MLTERLAGGMGLELHVNGLPKWMSKMNPDKMSAADRHHIVSACPSCGIACRAPATSARSEEGKGMRYRSQLLAANVDVRAHVSLPRNSWYLALAASWARRFCRQQALCNS